MIDTFNVINVIYSQNLATHGSYNKNQNGNKMKTIKITTTALAIATLAGCAAKQDITRYEAQKPKTVCIAEHKAVKEGIITAMQEGFAKHNIETKVVSANYVLKHQQYETDVEPTDIEGCNAVAYYVANWRWDLALYMAYANIWVKNVEQTETIAQASYRTGGGLDKFIDAKEKIIELVDAMFLQVKEKKTAQAEKTAI